MKPSAANPSRPSLLLAALLALSACSSGATPSTGADAGASSSRSRLTMKVDGQEWVAGGRVFGIASKGLIGFSGDLDEKGTEKFSVNIYADSPGTFVLDMARKAKDGSVATLFYKGDAFGTDNARSSLTFVVTKASGSQIEGTFSGTFDGAVASTTTLEKKLTITEGKFATIAE